MIQLYASLAGLSKHFFACSGMPRYNKVKLRKGEPDVPPQDEFELIRNWTERRQPPDLAAAAGVIVGIGDDAAVVADSPGYELLLAVDTMVEEVHFNAQTMTESDVGFKALAANVSDIAAMGGLPRHALVAVSVPPAWTPDRMRRLYDGLYECAERYGVTVVGGDTTSSPAQLVVTVTLTGTVPPGRAITRSGAKPGQLVFLTGPIGLSAAGLHGLTTFVDHVEEVPAALVQAHRRPAPSVRAGVLLMENGLAQSLNDISDGLASEAWEIAEASGVTLILRKEDLPLAGSLSGFAGRCRIDYLDWMLYGGEDYVLLGTAERSREDELRAAFQAAGLPLFVIGETTEGAPGVWLEEAGGKRKRLEKRGYNHFVKG